jgi:hypothetical protein
MHNSRELADWLLTKIKDRNPYTSRQRHLAFVWSTGFLARIVAELMWRDSHNYQAVLQILEQQNPK